MDDTTKEALSTIRSAITLQDHLVLGRPVDIVEKALEQAERERDEARRALEAATADNAALVEAARKVTGTQINAEHVHALARLLDEPHPGAPLLARLQHNEMLAMTMAKHLPTRNIPLHALKKAADALSRYILGEEP